MSRFYSTRYYLSLIPILLLSAVSAQDYYRQDSIQEVKIYFGYTNWDYRLDTAKAGNEDYILASYCLINGVRFDSVGVKYKGNSSYRAAQVKNPLHIKLDWVRESQNYNKITSMKFGNNFADPSAVREVLCYEILGHYMDCSVANFAKVYVNDQYLGLYSNVEAVNKKFCSDHFGSSEHVFVKGNPDRPSQNSTSNLVYINNDSSKFYALYGMENGIGWYKLIALMDSLKNNINGIPAIVDIDRSIWMHAFNSVFSNYDSYTGSFSQNYYLYEDDFGRFLPVIWDLNMAIGGFPGGTGGAATTIDKVAFFNGETNAARPLIQKILQNARYKKMFAAHVRTFCNEFIANQEYQKIALRLQKMVDSLVRTDPNSLTTYAAFQTSMTAPISSGGGPGQSAPGITTLMEARLNYFKTIAEYNAVPPVIGAPQWSSASPHIGDSIWLNVRITNGTDGFLAYRKNRYDLFTKHQLLDDGLHHDGKAGDGIYGAWMIPGGRKTQYYIYAENNAAGIFSPERAEFEYHVLNATNTFPTLQKGDLVINELMSVNQKTVIDSTDLKYEDWTELYNNSAQDISLEGYYLSNDSANPLKWEFPTGTSIHSKGLLAVWLDEDGNAPGLHANFKLSSSGEMLLLSREDGLVLDSITFGSLSADHSLERCPNGTGSFALTSKPSFLKINCSLTSVDEQEISCRLYPNPASNDVIIDFEKGQPVLAEFIDIQGKMVKREVIAHSGQMIELSGMAQGYYHVRLIDTNGLSLGVLKLIIH